MSVMYLSDNLFYTLASSINNGFLSVFIKDPTDKKILKIGAKKLANTFKQLNHDVYYWRYQDEKKEDCLPCVCSKKAVDNISVDQVITNLHCLYYQLSEQPMINNPIYKALSNIIDTLNRTETLKLENLKEENTSWDWGW